MATIQSIAARRERALQRIAKALEINLRPVKGVAEFRHACELEQIANELDPAGRSPAVSPEDGILREAPFTRHEDTIQDDGGGSPDVEESTAAVAVAPEPPAPTVPSAQPQRTNDHANNSQPQQQQRPQRVHGRR